MCDLYSPMCTYTYKLYRNSLLRDPGGFGFFSNWCYCKHEFSCNEWNKKHVYKINLYWWMFRVNICVAILLQESSFDLISKLEFDEFDPRVTITWSWTKICFGQGLSRLDLEQIGTTGSVMWWWMNRHVSACVFVVLIDSPRASGRTQVFEYFGVSLGQRTFEFLWGLSLLHFLSWSISLKNETSISRQGIES